MRATGKMRGLTGAVLFALSLSLTACGSSGSDYSGNSYAAATPAAEAAYDYDYAYDAEENGAGLDGSSMRTGSQEDKSAELQDESGGAVERKLVKTVDIRCETDNLDAFEEAIIAQMEEAGGYIESSNRGGSSSMGDYSYGRTGGRWGNYTFRVPASKLDGFVDTVTGSSNVLSQSSNVDDITMRYIDTESRIKALRIEQSQLLSMLEQAESVEDMITIQSRLSDVNASLQEYESSRKYMNNQVSYATVNVDVEEVVAYTPVVEKDAFTRMREGFIQSCKDVTYQVREFVIWIVINLPRIVLWLVILFLIILIFRFVVIRGNKKRLARAKKEKKASSGAYYSGQASGQYGLSPSSGAGTDGEQKAQEAQAAAASDQAAPGRDGNPETKEKENGV
ncbi:DUF4349 domain-containing protein [Lachnoclostridium sp. Marseille-P6806]|uniref:DUF4349 domain-containing protein n=1 Tax=Lachnoclostridium sp. Marseille-P6806 TaxID=2364793 RepID=UPI00102FE406|nr:DUF4349 domain-containing protein [Lachnoclostridium sp. Marseille-P6806]